MSTGQSRSAPGSPVTEPGKRSDFTVAGILLAAWRGSRGRLGLAWRGLGAYVGIIVLFNGAFLLLAPDEPGSYSFGLPNLPGLIDELVQGLILLPMLAGLFIFGATFARGLTPRPASIFEWYDHSLTLLLVIILSHLLILLGLLFFVLPGIYLLVCLQFAIPLAIDKQLGPWAAMRRSRELVTPVWFRMFTLNLIAGLLLAGSVLLLGIPLIWVLPVLLHTWGDLYDRLAGLEEHTVLRVTRPRRRAGLRQP
ncbi:hypothetical protein E4634_03815 [Mangrovimicrobium sediminis]|uniref:DUF975 family protein n=1 Tax=Mangrovimicrobium sediminis TaxID=2562682 RepID=A0A4Z0M6V2_9GAMM|nr:hypothetical protein [Haliea sp. SAOS-164]TGD75140.1 hypothetical protein E4634_03815 [Haliea sp. SAOS-164]